MRVSGYAFAASLLPLAAVFVTFAAQAGDAKTPTVDIGVGIANYALPQVSFLSIQDGLAKHSVSRVLNHDGGLAGFGIDAALSGNLATTQALAIDGALRGFFDSVGSTQTTDCVHADPFFCYMPAIVDDPSPDGNFTTIDGETFRTVAARTLKAWGAAAEALAGAPDGALRIGGGVDFRLLDQSLTLASDFVPDPGVNLRYSERLSTTYVGAYAAARAALVLWQGGSLVTTGRAGIYSAEARYNGNETQSYPSFPDDVYSLALTRRTVAFIAGAQGELKQEIGPITLSLYDNFQWYSWMPSMRYNDDDQGFPGLQVGTEIGDGTAWSNVAGVRALARF